MPKYLWKPLEEDNPLVYLVDGQEWKLYPEEFVDIPMVSYQLHLEELTLSILVEYQVPKEYQVFNDEEMLLTGDLEMATFGEAARFVLAQVDHI